MATKLSSVILLALCVLSATFALTHQKEDPQLRECKQECWQQPHYDQGMRRRCERRCEQQAAERERGSSAGDTEDNPGRDPAEKRLDVCREQCASSQKGEQQQRICQRRCVERYQKEKREQEQDDELDDMSGRDPARQRYQQCKIRCEQQRHDEQQRRQCVSGCEARYEEEKRSHRGDGNPGREEQGEEESTTTNPYFFGRESFKQVVNTQHGNVKILENFLSKSKLLLGIANYRVGILEANPHAFVMPHHLDSDAILFVAKGTGAITLICQHEKETKKLSHILNQGDILQVPAGTIMYLVNTQSNEKIIIVKLVQSVSTPGRTEVFFGAGGRDPESYLTSFSDEILEAAFNTQHRRLEQLFGQQKKGAIVRASEEQVRALSQHTSEGSHGWPFGGRERSSSPYSLLKKRPTYSSPRGQLIEVDAEDYSPLREPDVKVSFANITGGSMTAPFYNTRSTKIEIVLSGCGDVETVCPHVSHEHGHQRSENDRETGRKGRGEGEQEQGQRYQKFRSRIYTGNVVVVPPGHPSTTVACRGENLQVLCFEIRSENNQRTLLAGKNNVLSQLDREAKELSFDMPSRVVDEVLDSQKDAMFLSGPEERHSGRHQHPLESILEFAGFGI